MGYLIINKDEDGMRHEMRRSMRGGNYRHEGYHPMMHGGDNYEAGYRVGYRHGYEDSEDDDMDYRRARDSRGRFI